MELKVTEIKDRLFECKEDNLDCLLHYSLS